eukprot:1158288-Pelagomonas_calceolata.AAC.4
MRIWWLVGYETGKTKILLFLLSTAMVQGGQAKPSQDPRREPGQDSFGRGVTGGEAVQRKRKRDQAHRHMADNPPDPQRLFPAAPSLV